MDFSHRAGVDAAGHPRHLYAYRPGRDRHGARGADGVAVNPAAPQAVLLAAILLFAFILPSQLPRFWLFSGLIAAIVLMAWALASGDPTLEPLLLWERLEDTLIAAGLVTCVTLLFFPRDTGQLWPAYSAGPGCEAVASEEESMWMLIAIAAVLAAFACLAPAQAGDAPPPTLWPTARRRAISTLPTRPIPARGARLNGAGALYAGRDQGADGSRRRSGAGHRLALHGRQDLGLRAGQRADLRQGQSGQDANQGDARILRQPAEREVISLVVIGHDHPMIYDWTCKGKQPTITQQIFTVDARGFPAELWKAIAPAH